MEELPGHIGPYEVRDRLGQGGMGVVYLGFDPMLDRPVAIKVLKVPDEETRRRFLREARLAARVHHPHIVSIYAVGEHEGNPYLAMEFIAGRTMAQVIRGGDEIPLARKVRWLSELCAGLGHAHQSGIVHRDVKPSNLLIAQSTGTLRLLDFGIAHGNEASAMTMAGMIVGTPQYMSPEQITGQPVDARSDIFSVGAVAYELITGRQAFGGDNLYHVSRQIVGEQPRPIESFVSDAPSALVRMIARCLQKEPAGRPDNARTLERDFLAIARRLDPDHTLVVLPAEPTIVASPPKDVTTSRRQLLREVEDAIEQGELTTASGLLHKLEGAAAAGADVVQLRQRLQARRLEARVREALARAEDAVQTGTLEESEAALAGLAELSPRHPDLERLRLAHQTRIDDRMVASLTSRARLALQQDRLEEAEALLAEALALAPDASDVLAVQRNLADRTRAQRIARLVAQASRAIDNDDASGGRKAIDALVKIDPAHRDVARLQARLQAMHVEPAVAVPTPAAPVPRRTADAEAKPKAAARPAAAAPGPAAVLVRDPRPASPRDAEVLLLRPPAPTPEAASPDAPMADRGDDDAPAERFNRRWLVPVLVALGLFAALGVGAYRAWLRPGPDAPSSQVAAAPGARPTSDRVSPAGPAPTLSLTNGDAAAMPPGEPASPTPATPTEPAGAPDAIAPSSPVAAKGDPWHGVRQFSAKGAFDRAMTAIDQVQGVAPKDLQAERVRVVEHARRNALAARKGAEDMRLTRGAHYVLGMSRQAEADRQRDAGRLKTAVAAYMDARAHFLQAFTDGGKAPSPAVTAPAGSDAPAGPHVTAAGASPAAGGKDAGGVQAPAASADLSTWSNEEARAAIATFCGAYLGRDIGGLGRLWPAMEPAWRTEFGEAFGTEGTLVCVFESVNIVRTSEEFTATTRLLTQLPGGEQRRRALVISLVPARDRLVIRNIRVR